MPYAHLGLMTNVRKESLFTSLSSAVLLKKSRHERNTYLPNYIIFDFNIFVLYLRKMKNRDSLMVSPFENALEFT